LTEVAETGAAPGLREQKKQTKLLRIREAAQQVFAEKGFEAASMQEIARKAHVATGTLFLYAENKRDIVFLTTMPRFERANARGLEVPDDLPLAEQCALLFRPHYGAHQEDPAIARLALTEFTFFTGRQASRHAELQNALRAELDRRVTLAWERGLLRREVDPRTVAQIVFYVFQGEVRRWVREGAQDVAEGVAALALLIGLSLQGMEAAGLPADGGPPTG